MFTNAHMYENGANKHKALENMLLCHTYKFIYAVGKHLCKPLSQQHSE